MRPALLILGLLAMPTSHAQTPKEKFIRYGLLLDQALTLSDAGQHENAVPVFDSAFALVPFMANDHVPAILNALAAGRDDRANDLLIQGTENGLVIARHYHQQLQEFLRSERAMPFLNLQEYMHDRWLAHADTAMIRALDEVGGGSRMVVNEQGALHMEFDSTAIDRLIGLVQVHGVPMAAAVGDRIHAITNTCMDFAGDFPDGPKWRQLLPWLRSAMDRGRVPPDLLAAVQDRADMLHHRPMTYGELISKYADAPDHFEMLGKIQVDEARKAVGLGPLDHLLQRWSVDPGRVHFSKE
jgi:hypothetical protein